MIIYLLLVNVAMVISYSLYHFSFRKLTFFQWNRFYLLGTVILSLLIPIGLFIDLSDFVTEEIYLPVVDMSSMIDFPIIKVTPQQVTYNLMDVFMWTYWIRVALSMCFMLWKLWQVRKMFYSEVAFLGFSFFNKMFLGKEIQQYDEIERHERVHIEQGHSYDIVFLEIIKAFNWFNPIVYLISKEVKFQHECIADECSSEDKVAYAELLVAHAMQVNKNVLVHEFSNQSFLKKRIMMLFKNKSANNKKLLYLSVVPAVLVVGLSTIIFNTSRAKSLVAKVENKIEDVKMLGSETSTVQFEQKASSTIPLEIVETPIVELLQDTTKKKGLQEGGDELFSAVEVNPEPPGGMTAFRKWISENFKFPQGAIDAGVSGTIQTSFVVEKDGSLSDLKILRDLSYGTGQAAIELLKKSPRWSPGIQNGMKVRVSYNLPIRMDLSSEDNSSVEKEVLRSNVDANSDNMVFNKTEVMPEPTGGMVAFRKWISDNFKYPQSAIDAGVNGTIKVRFIVDKDGSLSFIESVSNLGYGLEQSAVELMKSSPKWKPAVQNGKKVRVDYTLPIRINLEK